MMQAVARSMSTTRGPVIFWILAFLLGVGPVAATGAAAPSAVARAEISRLLEFVERADCSFNRNGTWYDGKAARAHLEQKERYLEDRGQIGSAEDFIEKAATRSSMTGQRYSVRCGSATIPSADWLRSELARIRAIGDGPGTRPAP
jgi:hypothetical protein